jgi:hypothetical protein
LLNDAILVGAVRINAFTAAIRRDPTTASYYGRARPGAEDAALRAHRHRAAAFTIIGRIGRRWRRDTDANGRGRDHRPD